MDNISFENQELVNQAEQLLAEEPAEPKMNRLFKLWFKFRWLVITVLILVVAYLIYTNFIQPFDRLSPLALGEVLSAKTSRPEPDYQLIGFLPYWSINRGKRVDWQSLDEVILFDLSVDSQGDIGQDQQDKVGLGRILKSDKFAQIKSEAEASNTQLGIALTCFNDQSLNQFLSSQTSRDNFINQAIDLIEQYGFESLNIDFEFVDLAQPRSTQQAFVRLLEQLKAELPGVKLSFDVYANAVIKHQPYDLVALSPVADQMIIMAYDFHRSNSDNSGPVAPLQTPYASARSILETLQASFGLFPADKTILGVPLYGYEWQTLTKEAYAVAVPQTGALASLDRTEALITDQDLEVQWDSQALSPWLVYEDDSGRIKQIYFENLYSLSLKYQLVKQAELAGVAYWALGYEPESGEVWGQAVEKLKPSQYD